MADGELFQTLPLFDAILNASERVIVNQGGTSSAKTYSILQVLFFLGMQDERQIITVVGQDIPNLKVGAFRDAKNIRNSSEALKVLWPFVNEGDREIRCVNGSLMEFKSYDDAQDAKSGKRDYLFVNEANGIPYEIYWQLAMRTRKKVYIDYNPSERFWAHDKVIGTANTRLIISDHRRNFFLSEEEHARIENIADPELWKVYARGLTGKLEGVVFQNWDIVEALPPRDEWAGSWYGLDFGFTSDPSALEHVGRAHGDLWIDEVLYETGLTNPMIAERARSVGMTDAHEIVADSAEPKSITELNGLGLWVTPSIKGADSIIVGIDILKRYRIHFTRRSVGIIDNARSYKWSHDKYGNQTNKPEDKNNHGIDAIRYVALKHLAVKRAAKGVRVRN